jgi:hypothetical protein
MRPGLTALAVLMILAPAGLAEALTLKGLDPGEAQEISPADFAALPHVTLKVSIHGRERVFEGVPMLELLRRVNAPWGDTLTGKDLSDVALVTCQDGYKVAFSLGEIDPGTAKGQVLVADRADGAPLDAHAGPFQIVVQDDARPARDARMVAKIELIRLAQPSK